jgi:transposase-like protein
MTSRTRDTHTPDTPDDLEGQGVQAVLPLDLDPDEPVPYRLTPKARRVVAPHAMPMLEVVDPAPAHDDATHDHGVPVDLDDPHDPRSARARALRRGGMSVAAIARRLDVDELAVRTWTGDLDLRGRRRPRLHAVHDGGAADTPAPAPAPAAPDDADDRLARHHAAFARARREAADAAGPRMADPTFVRGLALTVAATELDEHALLVSLRDRDVARTVRAWLVEQAEVDPRELRVVVRLGATAGADLVLHRWADALDLPPERLSRTHWRSAPSEEAVEVLLRVPDARVAARVAGWRDALLGAEELQGLPTGVGF